jgi:hypothetical protein
MVSELLDDDDDNNSNNNNNVTCSCVTYKTGFGLDDWIYCTLHIYTTKDYRQSQRYRYCTHTFQFTFTHALRFLAFTSRVLATDLSQSHCNFKSQVKPSCNGLIPLWPFLLNRLRLPSPEFVTVL